MRSTSVPRTARVVAVLAALAVVLGACGSSDKEGSGGSGSSTPVTLNGSGSTFQKTFDEAAIAAYTQANTNATINYAGGGSGKGKTDLQTGTVDFAGTDSLIKDEDKAKYTGGEVLYVPTVAAPITVSYNLSGVDKLQLSAPTLAKIFDGAVKKWNDPAVAADNPGVNLPSTDLVMVHRADGSGTTSNFTKYLTAAAGSDWTLGTGDTVNWPASSQAGQGNAGVATIVKQTDGAIGYVDYSDAVASGLKFAAVKNADGKYVAASLEGAEAALAGAKVNDDLTYNPLNAPGADAYPITSPTWIILYANQTDKVKGQAVKDFLTFVLGEGQTLAPEAKYAALPQGLLDKAKAQLNKIQVPA